MNQVKDILRPFLRVLLPILFISYMGSVISFTHVHIVDGVTIVHAHPHETDVLHGCAMMVRRDVIERAGPMFEGYFLFYEEFDWSLRMREAGYKLFYDT